MQAVTNYLSEVNYKRIAVNTIGLSALIVAAVAAVALVILLAPTIFPASFAGAILSTGLSVTSVSSIGAGTLISGILAIALANTVFINKRARALKAIQNLLGGKEKWNKLPIVKKEPQELNDLTSAIERHVHPTTGRNLIIINPLKLNPTLKDINSCIFISEGPNAQWSINITGTPFPLYSNGKFSESTQYKTIKQLISMPM